MKSHYCEAEGIVVEYEGECNWCGEKEMTPEGKVKAKIKKVLKDNDIYYIMPATGGYGNSGAPDFIVCHEGKFIGIETKAGKNKPTALQQRNIDQINAQGGLALVVNEENVDSICRFLTKEKDNA